MIENKQPKEVRKIWERKKYLALLNDWAENSTCFDGIPSIGNAETILWKLVWIVAFLICNGYCTYSLAVILTDYFNYDVTTQISIKRLPSIEFPTVKRISNIFY